MMQLAIGTYSEFQRIVVGSGFKAMKVAYNFTELTNYKVLVLEKSFTEVEILINMAMLEQG